MTILEVLREQKKMRLKGSLYHRIQIDLTYNSNHIEGCKLTHDQTRYIFETNTIGVEKETTINIDDILETVNHFRCIDLIIDKADEPLDENLVKEIHRILKEGTSDSRKDWFNVGDYKQLPNEVGGIETTLPENVHAEMEELITQYNKNLLQCDDKMICFDYILDFHKRFETIHPFQDGNGRVGRLIMFKECLRNDIVPFIITDDLRYFYYRGLSEWGYVREYLRDTCLTAQDKFKEILDYFRIDY